MEDASQNREALAASIRFVAPTLIQVFTIVSCTHLADARVLMASVARHLPEAKRTIFVTDDVAGRFSPSGESFEVLSAALTALPRYRQRAFAFSASELCFVLKPFCARFLFAHSRPEILLYLDADTLLLAPPMEIIAAADTHGLVLTPHITDPVRNEDTPVATMRSPFNGGIFALRGGRLADRFLDWWGRQLAEPTKIAADWYHDQGWLNLVPALFPEYALLRHPGYNVAFWNLHERDVTLDPQLQPLANGMPLVLFHFSYFDPKFPDVLTGNLATRCPKPNRIVTELLASYATSLYESGYRACREWTYGFGAFSNGAQITSTHRHYFVERLYSSIPETLNPFDSSLRVPGYCGLRSLYRANHPLTRAVRMARGLFR